jgi:hypothetical protein
VPIIKDGPAHDHIFDNRFAAKARQHLELSAELPHFSGHVSLSHLITASAFFTFIVMFMSKFRFSLVFFFTFIFIFTFKLIFVFIFIFVFFLLL